MYKTIMGRSSVEDSVTPEFILHELLDAKLTTGTPEYARARFTKFRVRF